MTNQIETVEGQPQPHGQGAEVREIHDAGFLPVLSIQEAQHRSSALKQFVRENLRRDVDYGIIPGTGDKPTLLKPGAEKLCTFFGLRSQFEIIERTQDWERGFFNFWYKCRLFRGALCQAEGEGSANSYERKYRWRMVPSFKASDEERSRAVREETRRTRDGRAYKMLVLENEDPYTLVNTLQKMAQKRALIAATLIAVNASEFFTQDIEDMVVDTDLEPVSAPQIAAAPQITAAPQERPAEEARVAGGEENEPEPAGRREAREEGQDLFGSGGEARTEESQLTLKFKERPNQEVLQTIKSAGFRWNSKRLTWEAPATEDRRNLVDELTRTHKLAA